MGRIERNELTSYDDCADHLGGRNSRKLRYSVQLIRDGADITVVHHATPIVRYRPDGTVVLDCDGYRSKSSKDNLNRYTGYYVWQRNGEWFVDVNPDGESDVRDYEDGMELSGSPSRSWQWHAETA